MSNTRYTFNEFSEDDARHSLAQKAKILLQQNMHISNAYQSHRNEFFGMTECISYLMDLHKESFVLKCQNKFIDEVKRTRLIKRSESRKKNPSTPVKTNQNTFTALQPKHLSFDNIANELSENVTKSLGKEPTSVKEILRATESENSSQENSPVLALMHDVSQNVSTSRRKTSTLVKLIESPTELKNSPQEDIPVSELISDASQIVSASGRQQSTPVKININATELESLPSKNLSPGHKEINYADPVNLNSNTTGIQRAFIDLSTKIRSDNINPILQDHETVGQSDADKGKVEKSDEAVNMSVMSTKKVKRNPSPYKEVRVQGVSNTDCRINTRSRENPAASDNQNSFSPIQESPPIFLTSQNETEDFSPAKIAKISGDSGTKSHISPSFEKKTGILDQDCETNNSPNQEINVFKSCERKRKSPSRRKNTVPTFILLFSTAEVKTGKCFLSIDYPALAASSIQCRSIKRNLNVSRAIEIDVSVENPKPTMASISSIDPKSVKATTCNTDPDKFRKVTTFGGNESNPGTSRDYCPSAKDSTSNSSSVSGYKNSSIGDVIIDIERDRLSCEILQTMHIQKRSIKNVSARVSRDLDLELLEYCIAKFKNLLSSRTKCCTHINKSLKNLKYSLDFLCHYIEVTVDFLYDISILRSDHVSEKLQQYIYTLVVTAIKLLNELEELKIYVLLDLQNWVINFNRNNRKIYPHYKPLEYNGKPSINLEYLHAFENHAKLIWVLLDEEIKNAECKRLHFLSTEKDFMKFISMFFECLVNVGIVKLLS